MTPVTQLNYCTVLCKEPIVVYYRARVQLLYDIVERSSKF
jgi:hypothetical protein